MKIFPKPGRTSAARTEPRWMEQERARLLAIFEACAAVELAATLAVDSLARRGRKSAPLARCASVCGETAAQLAGLEVPDPRRVQGALSATRQACADARAVCEVHREDALARRAMMECHRCERACQQVLGVLELAA